MSSMEKLNDFVTRVDDFVWGPVMLVLLVGTGVFLTFRTRFLTWRNLGYALKSTLSKEPAPKAGVKVTYRRFRLLPLHLLQPLVPVILLVLPLPWFPVVPEPWSGCGSLLHLVLLPNSVSVCLPSNIVKSMPKAK